MHSNVLGQRIKDLRMKKGLTQQQLAAGICTSSMVSQVESGRARPSHEVLLRFANRLDVALEVLMSEANQNLKNSSKHKLARALMACEHYSSARGLLEEVMTEPDTRTPIAEVKCDLAECYIQEKAYDKAYPLLHDVLEEATITKNSGQLAVSLQHLGEIEFSLQRYTFALRHWIRAVEVIQRSAVRNRLLLVPLLIKLGVCHQLLNQDAEAVSCFKQVARINEHSKDLSAVAEQYLYLSAAYRSAGDYWRAGIYAERATGIREGLEVVSLGEQVRVNYAHYLESEMELEQKVVEVRDKILSLEEAGSVHDAGVHYIKLAKLYEQLDEYELTMQICKQADQVLPSSHPERTELYRVWAWAAHGSGDWGRAEELFRLASEERTAEEVELDGLGDLECVERGHSEMGQ